MSKAKSITKATSNCRAYPDEKGIETTTIQVLKKLHDNCRAYPDEKGIETPSTGTGFSYTSFIAEPIPMKRELKQYRHHTDNLHLPDCRAYPDEKGIETYQITRLG